MYQANELERLQTIAPPIDALWMPGKVTKLKVADSIPESSRTTRVSPADLLGPIVSKWESSGQSTGKEWNCFLSPDLIVSGIGVTWKESNLILDPDLMPDFWRSLLYRPEFASTFSIQRESTLPIRDIPGYAMPFTTWGFRTYGHVLLDALPRLRAAQHLFGVAQVKAVVRHDTPKWALDMCRKAGLNDSQLCFFDALKERIRVEHGIFPAFARSSDYGIHPFVGRLFDGISTLPPFAAQRKGAFFLSRAALPEWRKQERLCVNEDEILSIAQSEFGCEIFLPETLDWIEQIKLFRSAQAIIGFAGSGLHTSIFSDERLSIGMIGANALAQLQVCALRRQRLAVLEKDIPTAGSFRVEPDRFRRMMHALLQF